MTRDGILILDSEGSTIVDANPFLTALLGYTRAEIVGRRVEDVGLLVDRTCAERLLQTALHAGYACCETMQLRTRDGRTIVVEVVGNSYRVDDKKVIQLNIIDTSDRDPARTRA